MSDDFDRSKWEPRPPRTPPRFNHNVVDIVLPLDYPMLNGTDVSAHMEESEREAFDHIERMIKLMHRGLDARYLTDRLRLSFGSAHSFFHSGCFLLEQMGLNHNDALFFSKLREIGRHSEVYSYYPRPRMDYLKVAAPYIAAHFEALEFEHFYLFCINKHGRQKGSVLLSRGIEDRTLFSLKMMLAEIVRFDPAAIIVAHNHPNGTMRPSDADLQCTEEIMRAASTLEAPLLDHVIVAGEHVVSLRENGFFPESMWLSQHPNNRFLRNWLKEPPAKKPRKPKVLTPEEEAAARRKAYKSACIRHRKTKELALSNYRRYSRKAEKAMKIYERMLSTDHLYDPDKLKE